MAKHVDWELVPETAQQIDAVAEHCRRLVTRRALVGAGVITVPAPTMAPPVALVHSLDAERSWFSTSLRASSSQK